jgi:hypothetical protein
MVGGIGCVVRSVGTSSYWGVGRDVVDDVRDVGTTSSERVGKVVVGSCCGVCWDWHNVCFENGLCGGGIVSVIVVGVVGVVVVVVAPVTWREN